MGSNARTIIINFTNVNAWATYNITLSRPTLNKLRVVASTSHLCMKYHVVDRVGLRVGQRMEGQKQREVISRSDIHRLDLDPHQEKEGQSLRDDPIVHNKEPQSTIYIQGWG
ncbi:hypothetical protein CR513_48121, partial [Mucuna pruriens]